MENKQKTDFKAFDTTKIDEYTEQAKASWGNTPQWKEYEQKKKEAKEDFNEVGEQMMQEIFGEFGKLKEKDPASQKAQDLVKKLQDFITEHFYTCTNEVLSGLGKMYAGGGEFTANIDAVGGDGTADIR